DGKPLDKPLTAAAATIANGVLPSTSIPPDGILVISAGGTKTEGVVAWGQITACRSLSVSTFFELRDARTNVLYSRVGVEASPANMSTFLIPRIREVSAGLDVGIALVNTGSAGTKATLHAELRNASGGLIKATDIEMAGGSQ